MRVIGQVKGRKALGRRRLATKRRIYRLLGVALLLLVLGPSLDFAWTDEAYVCRPRSTDGWSLVRETPDLPAFRCTYASPNGVEQRRAAVLSQSPHRRLAVFLAGLGVRVFDIDLVGPSLAGFGIDDRLGAEAPARAAALATILLGAGTVWLGWQTRRMAMETQDLVRSTAKELVILERQTAAFESSASAAREQLENEKAQARQDAQPVIQWARETYEVVPLRDAQGSPFNVRVQCVARNVGGAAVMGTAKTDGSAAVDVANPQKVVGRAESYFVWVTLGPFESWRSFEAVGTLFQQLRALHEPEQWRTSAAVVSVAGQSENAMSVQVFSRDRPEDLPADVLSEALDRHRALYR